MSEDKPPLSSSPNTVLVWDLSDGKLVGGATPPEKQKFFRPYGPWISFRADGKQAVLPFFHPEVGLEINRTIQNYFLCEFPSGKPLRTVSVPKEYGVTSVEYRAEGVLESSSGDFAVEKGQEYSVHRWDPETGKYLGASKKTRLEDRWPGINNLNDLGIERGEKLAHCRFKNDPDLLVPIWDVTVWDKNKRSPNDRPLFTVDAGGLCQLSPDGRRLLVAVPGNPSKSVAMICTTTGRELLKLEYRAGLYLGESSILWSFEGSFFWTGVDAYGKRMGYDFRPVEPKK